MRNAQEALFTDPSHQTLASRTRKSSVGLGAQQTLLQEKEVGTPLPTHGCDSAGTAGGWSGTGGSASFKEPMCRPPRPPWGLLLEACSWAPSPV